MRTRSTHPLPWPNGAGGLLLHQRIVLHSDISQDFVIGKTCSRKCAFKFWFPIFFEAQKMNGKKIRLRCCVAENVGRRKQRKKSITKISWFRKRILVGCRSEAKDGEENTRTSESHDVSDGRRGRTWETLRTVMHEENRNTETFGPSAATWATAAAVAVAARLFSYTNVMQI